LSPNSTENMRKKRTQKHSLSERRDLAKENEKKFVTKLRKILKLYKLNNYCTISTHNKGGWFSAFDVVIKFTQTKTEPINIEVKVRNNSFYEYDLSGYRKFVFDSFYLNEEKVKRSIAFAKEIMVVWVNSEEMDSLYFLPRMSAILKSKIEIVADARNGDIEYKYKIPKELCIHGWGNFIEYISRYIRKDKTFVKWS